MRRTLAGVAAEKAFPKEKLEELEKISLEKKFALYDVLVPKSVRDELDGLSKGAKRYVKEKSKYVMIRYERVGDGPTVEGFQHLEFVHSPFNGLNATELEDQTPVEEMIAAMDAVKNHASDRKQLYNDVLRQLGKVTTVKKLEQVWPEIMELVPSDWIDKQQSTALALPVSDLNAKIGIPTHVDN